MAVLGAHNPNVQNLRRLTGRRRARTEAGAFVIDGPVLVTEARAAGIELLAVFVAADAAPVARRVADAVAATGIPVHDVAPEALTAAVDPVTPNGIAAVARTPRRRLADLEVDSDDVVVVLAGVADPGNAGTILRSAEASGVAAVISLAGSVDLFAPKVVRAAAGALFRLPVVADTDPDALALLAGRGLRPVGTVADGGEDYTRAPLARGVAIVVGSEAHGIDPALHRAIDAWVTIPMAGPTESLNVAMATTLVCFESARQRRGAE